MSAAKVDQMVKRLLDQIADIQRCLDLIEQADAQRHEVWEFNKTIHMQQGAKNGRYT